MPDTYYMREPCKHCPFRRDVKPFLHPERGTELAYHAGNPYNTFPCHKTTESDEESDYSYRTSKSLECAGFMALQHNETGCQLPDGFISSDKVYGDSWEMIDSYENQ